MSLYTTIFGEPKPSAEELARQREKERLAKLPPPPPPPYSKTKKALILTAIVMCFSCFLFLCYVVVTNHRQNVIERGKIYSVAATREKIRGPAELTSAMKAVQSKNQVYNVEVYPLSTITRLLHTTTVALNV